MRKQILVLGLSLMSFSTFANTTDITVCLKQLNNANFEISSLQSELRSCQTSRPGSGSVGGREDANLREQLKAERQRSFELDQTIKGLQVQYTDLQRENSSLQRSNSDLQRENSDLRYRIQQLERYGNGRDHDGYGNGQQTLGYFVIAGCTTSTGEVDLRYSASAEASRRLEAETLAIEAVKRKYNCGRGISIHKTEEIRTSQKEARFCRAACSDANGNAVAQYMKSGTGRNMLEAQFSAIENVKKSYNCGRSIVIKDCE